MPGLCPHCNKMINNVNLEKMTSSSFMGTQWNTIGYACPFCQKIITVSIDPIAIKTDIIEALRKNEL